MSNNISYATVIGSPGSMRFFIPGLIGRSAFAMIALSLIFAFQDSTGSLATAGLSSALFGISNVIASPLRARLVDAYGHRKVLNLLALGFGGSIIVLSAVLEYRSAWTLLSLALCLSGGLSTPPLGAASRALWAAVSSDESVRTRAYSLDAVCEELLYVAGPLFVALISSVSANGSLLVTGSLCILGTLGMTSSEAAGRQKGHANQDIEQNSKNSWLGPLKLPSFPSLLLLLVGVGLILGVVEIAATAFADSSEASLSAGVTLAIFAVASAIGGLLYGRVTWTISPSTRLQVLLVCMGGSAGLLYFVESELGFVVGLLVLGFILAPSMVSGYLVADSLTPSSMRTESSSWINTSINLGAALGAGVGGIALEDLETTTVIALFGLAALLTLLPSLISRGSAPVR